TTTGGLVTTGIFSTAANTFCEGNDSRLSDARTPTDHASSHLSSGGDTISLFNTASAVSGLTPGSGGAGATYYLNATGNWTIPAGGAGVTIGSDNEIPYSNSGGTDFDYSPKFNFDGNTFNFAQTVAGTNATFNLTHSDNTNAGSNVAFVMNVAGGATTNFYAYNDVITGTLGGMAKGGGSFIYAGSDSSVLGLVTAGQSDIGFATNNILRFSIGGSASAYSWRTNSANEDITHKLIQVATTKAVMGWDNSGG
ncbi:unnamed protein product, partial [marine sediment metagenome]